MNNISDQSYHCSIVWKKASLSMNYHSIHSVYHKKSSRRSIAKWQLTKYVSIESCARGFCVSNRVVCQNDIIKQPMWTTHAIRNCCLYCREKERGRERNVRIFVLIRMDSNVIRCYLPERPYLQRTTLEKVLISFIVYACCVPIPISYKFDSEFWILPWKKQLQMMANRTS